MKVEVESGGVKGEAKLLMVENQIETNSATVRLYARQPNPGGTLLPGVFAQVRLLVEEPKEQFLINEQVIVSQLNGRFVYIVGEGGVTSLLPITLGKRERDICG